MINNMDNNNVIMTIIVEPRNSESLTILFKEGQPGTTTNTYELDLEEVDIDWLTATLQNIKKLRGEGVGKVTFEHILGSEKE